MAEQHTPGPWLIREFPTRGGARPQLWVMDATPDRDGKVMANAICSVTGTNPAEQANARLIAAAPEMLAACRGLLDALESMGALDHPDLRSDVAATRDAVARATGQPAD